MYLFFLFPSFIHLFIHLIYKQNISYVSGPFVNQEFIMNKRRKIFALTELIFSEISQEIMLVLASLYVFPICLLFYFCCQDHHFLSGLLQCFPNLPSGFYFAATPGQSLAFSMQLKDLFNLQQSLPCLKPLVPSHYMQPFHPTVG